MSRSSYWIKRNAQRELRDNLRTTIKDRGLSQREAAERAGFTAGWLTTRLSSRSSVPWIRRSQVTAFAEVLDLSADELIGDSGFQGDSDLDRFDYNPDLPRHEEKDDAATGRTRALCCGCGALRTTDARAIWDSTCEDPGSPRGRFTTPLHCFTCETTTRHALLVLRSDHQQWAEQTNRIATEAAHAQRELAEEVARIEGHSVDIYWRVLGPKARAKERTVAFEYDDSKSRWRIEIDENTPPLVQLRSLKRAWEYIAVADFSDVDFDPRNGAVFKATPSDWDDATDDLIQDIQRALPLERAVLAADLRIESDSTDEAEASQ